MRVIAGSARSVPLKAPEGLETRPTTDRIKETLFNIIQFEIPGCLFMDIFAGSGAIGIEALSRGAKRAVFIDSSKKAADCIRANVEKCGFESRCDILRADASYAAGYLERAALRDYAKLVIFMDPPYDRGLEVNVLKSLSGSGRLKAGSIAVIEESLNCDTGFVQGTGFEVYRVKEYKNQKHVFLRLAGYE